MRLRALDQDLWTVDYDQRLAGGLAMPTRMSIVRLSDGRLWLHSPVPLTDEVARAIEGLGPVAYLVAPSRMHDLYAHTVHQRWPEAELWVAPSLAELHRGTWSIAGRLDRTVPDSWASTLRLHAIEGAPRVDEFVFLHLPSRTLVVTDLVFHLHAPPNLQTRLLLWCVGALNRLAMSRSWRWFFIRDRERAAASIQAVLGWDFERILMCHGEPLESGGRQALARTTAWLVQPRYLAGSAASTSADSGMP